MAIKTTLFTAALLAVCAGASAQSLTVVPSSALTGSLMLRPGRTAPQGNYQAFDTTGDVAFGKTATASNSLAGFADIHDVSYLTDGNYGNGASWIAGAADSFITIDLGSVFDVTSVKFGRDRLGGYDDRDPGQFTISTSLDNLSFTQVFDSNPLGFSGNISGAQTLQATLAGPTFAKYVRLQFANDGTDIDEVEVQAVPEPSTFAVLGLAGLAFIRRRR